MKSFDERIALAFPDGEPQNQVAFLRGEMLGHSTAIYQAIAATATAARNSQTEAITRLHKLETQLVRRREELGLIVTEGEEVFDLSAGEMARRIVERQALETIIAQIEAAIARIDSEGLRSAAENWSALEQLAKCRAADQIPPASVAALFEASPEQLTTPARWARHVAEIEAARLAEVELEAAAAAAETERQEAQRREEEVRQRAFDEEMARIEQMDTAGLLRHVFGHHPYDYLKSCLLAGDRAAAEQTRQMLTYRLLNCAPDALRRRIYHRLWDRWEKVANGRITHDYPDVRRQKTLEQLQREETARATWKPPECTPEEAERVDAMSKDELLALLFGQDWRQVDCLRNFYSTAQMSAAGPTMGLLRSKASDTTPVRRRVVERLIKIHDELNTARQARA